MKTLANNTRTENMNAAQNMAASMNPATLKPAEKIDDFGQKIGGARKDLYQAANEWAAQLATITAESLTKAGGVSKLVRLPNLEKMTEAGAITADQARAALIIWRGIERKPQGSYRADRWAERTRARLEAVAAVLTKQEPAEDFAKAAAEIINSETAADAPEMRVLTAANWPAVPFSFGKYGVIRSYYGGPNSLHISAGGRRYFCQGYTDAAEVVARLRELVTADEAAATARREAGPRLGVFWLRHELKYYIAPEEKKEISLKEFDDINEARQYLADHRAELVARYEELKKFPECRREWNRPRIGQDWRKGENMTPESFAAVLPFRGVEFGNWVNQTERAALLNAAFDGFHDLADVLHIAPAAVCLRGSLAFAFASRGHSGAAAHYEPARRVINLTKRAGAGCMAHEWWHAVDNFAAGGGLHNYATEQKSNPAAFAILEAIKETDYYTRSLNLATFKNAEYWVTGRELTARAFEGVTMCLLDAAGVCSDFLANVKNFDEFTAEDVAHRSEFYPYPTKDEAAALLPYYVAFLREVFGEGVTVPAAIMAEAENAARRIEQEKAEAERIRAEKAAELAARIAADNERRRQEYAARQAREAEEKKQAAAHTVETVREVLTARHFDAIATTYDAAAVYAVAHLEGEIYTLCADIKKTNAEGRPYVAQLPAACIQYKRVHNAKRIICRRYQVPEIRANKWNARELCESLSADNMGAELREVVRAFESFEKGETWQKAAELWNATQRAHAEQGTKKAAEGTKADKPTNTKADTQKANSENGAPVAGLHLEDTADGVRVIGEKWQDTYFNKKAIKANGAHWNKDTKFWEATDPADVARLRAWFALRDEEQTTPAAGPTTLENPGEITAPAGLPEWLTVGARVRTAGRWMTNAATMRPVWVEGQEMTVKEINAEFVELETRDENGQIKSLESVAICCAADSLTPVLYEACEITAPAEAEPMNIAASYDTNDAPQAEPAEDQNAATYETTATDEEQKTADALPFMEKAAILDKVTARIYAPWGDVSKMWLCPFRGAKDVWNAWGDRYNFRDFGRLADWALTAKVGERAEYRGLMVQIWERDGQTATEPTEEADRLKANRETRERLRAAIVAEIEAAGIYLYSFANEMKVLGKCANADELVKVEDIARRYSSAKFVHEDNAAVFEFDLPLFFPHFFPTDPEPEPSGEGDTVTLQKGETCAASCWVAYAPEDLNDLSKGYSVYDVYDTESEARDDLQKALKFWHRRGNVIEHTGNDWFTWLDRENSRRHLHFICTAPTDWQARAAEILAALPTDPKPERHKSAKDIREQASRIIDAAAFAAWDGNEYRNQERLNNFMDKISAISERYINNICRHFGRNDNYLENRYYAVPVARDIYAAAEVAASYGMN